MYISYARNVSNYKPRFLREPRARRPFFRSAISIADCLIDAHLEIVTPYPSEEAGNAPIFQISTQGSPEAVVPVLLLLIRFLRRSLFDIGDVFICDVPSRVDALDKRPNRRTVPHCDPRRESVAKRPNRALCVLSAPVPIRLRTFRKSILNSGGLPLPQPFGRCMFSQSIRWPLLVVSE